MTEMINPEMLILARELRGMTQSELAEITSINQGIISRYESEMREISSKDLVKIAAALDFPEAFFYRPGQRHGLGSSGLFHRKRQSVSNTVLKMLQAKINLVRLDFEHIFMNEIEFDKPVKFPQFDVKEIGSIERIADLVRATWNLPMGPIQNLIESIEDAGGIVYMADFGTNKIDAIVQWVDPLPPVFLVNRQVPGDRLRFTLAHEIGHLVMHAILHDQIEEEADQFAAAFLMPASEIITDFTVVNLARLAQLKPYWKVSIQALIRRAKDLNKITERQYRSLNAELSSLGHKVREPNPLPLEKSTLIKEVVDTYINELGYSVGELARLLRIHEREVRSLYMQDDDDIRLVAKNPDLNQKEKQKKIDS